MKWEKPAFLEIGMNAEIGGYQSDFGDSEPTGPRNPVVGEVQVSGTSNTAGNRAPRPL